MHSFGSALSRLSRRLNYPMVIGAVRLVVVAQAIALPFSAPMPKWAQLAVLAYLVLATALSIPGRAKPSASEDKTSIKPPLFAAIALLDASAGAFTAWQSGPNALPVVLGFDAALLTVGSGFALVVVSAIAYGVGSGERGESDAVFGGMQGLAIALGPYLVAAFAMLARRSAEQQIRAINHVLDAGSDLGTKLSMPDVLTQLLNMLRQFRESVPWQNAIVYISRYDDTLREDALCAEAIAGSHADFYRGNKLRFGEGIVGHAAVEQRPLIVADLQREHRDSSLPKPKAVHGTLVVPIVSEAVTIGCVMLTSAMSGAYTFDHQRLVDRLIRLASVGIQNARLHSKTLELADTDSMTGLLTNRAYQERLELEFRKSQSGKLSLALMIIDVDYFKHINDTYGHPQGDELLRQLGELIRQHARRDDICCRYGGDEFTVVMPQTIKAEAAMVAGRIRQAVEDKVFQLDGATAKITISIGVAGYPQDTSTKSALVKSADDALYTAKQSGRNNIKLANRLQLQPKTGASATPAQRMPTPIDGAAGEAPAQLDRPLRR
jgi:diguanylate cyclase (GGDEF)-like protein